MSDNHSWNHVGSYGNSLVKTPNIDKVAEQGIQFQNAFSQSPSCSPARAAMLTGRNIWELDQAANLWSSFPSDLTVFPDLLEKNGYKVGIEGKGWNPGNYKETGWERNPAGERYFSIREFFANELNEEEENPWLYWFSSDYPTRPFKSGGEHLDEQDKLAKVDVPPYLPDVKEVRGDILDYYDDVYEFDKEVGRIMNQVDELGELENTIVIVLSDNGWQMPRGLANLYDSGTRVPFIISWPGHFEGGRNVKDFVTLNDLAPTFLGLAGIDIPKEMTAKSILSILKSDEEGLIDSTRDHTYLARERHAYAREGGLGYPERAIRTNDFLYIRNYKPERWPAGDPPLYGDVDANSLQFPAPTKMYMLKNKGKDEMESLFELSFGKRPGEELYDLQKDPHQIKNVADDPVYQEIKNRLSTKLTNYLSKTGDPREGGPAFNFDNAKYYLDADKTPEPSDKAIKALDLKEEYNY